MEYLKIYNTLDSTNKEAQRLLAAGQVSSGLTILARHQVNGRGQYGRVWVSAPKSHLAMSLVYKPINFDATALPTIGMKASLGIVRALREIDPQLSPMIKWPNDIYLEDKKLCGILIENALLGSRVQHSIIGIGMNVNESNFPQDLPNPTSLSLATGSSYDIEKTAIIIRQAVMDTLEETGTLWKEEYNQTLYGIERLHIFQTTQGKLEAKIKGVSLQGHLQLELPNGRIRPFATHELKWEIT
jgi:BirA family biotin operon repressor/biotin-[acetyl-CoA-carboxylase] ligase